MTFIEDFVEPYLALFLGIALFGRAILKLRALNRSTLPSSAGIRIAAYHIGSLVVLCVCLAYGLYALGTALAVAVLGISNPGLWRRMPFVGGYAEAVADLTAHYVGSPAVLERHIKSGGLKRILTRGQEQWNRDAQDSMDRTLNGLADTVTGWFRPKHAKAPSADPEMDDFHRRAIEILSRHGHAIALSAASGMLLGAAIQVALTFPQASRTGDFSSWLLGVFVSLGLQSVGWKLLAAGGVQSVLLLVVDTHAYVRHAHPEDIGLL